MFAIVRTVAMLLVSSFAGSYMASETPASDSTEGGFKGYWQRAPTIAKVALWAGLILGLVSVFNWVKTGNFSPKMNKGGKP